MNYIVNRWLNGVGQGTVADWLIDLICLCFYAILALPLIIWAFPPHFFLSLIIVWAFHIKHINVTSHRSFSIMGLFWNLSLSSQDITISQDFPKIQGLGASLKLAVQSDLQGCYIIEMQMTSDKTLWSSWTINASFLNPLNSKFGK